MSALSRRLANLEKTNVSKGRTIFITVPYGHEDEDHSHLFPADVTPADTLVMVIDYSSSVSVAPMAPPASSIGSRRATVAT